jgi:hypothetical protein
MRSHDAFDRFWDPEGAAILASRSELPKRAGVGDVRAMSPVTT